MENPNFEVHPIGPSKNPGIKEKFNAQVSKIKSWIRKVGRIVSVVGMIALLLLVISALLWGGEIRFAITNSNEVSHWQKISPEIRERALKVAQELQEEIEAQKKEKIDQFFPEKKEEKGKQQNVGQVNLTLTRVAKEGREVLRKVTAYNSVDHQTDDTPCFAEPSKNNICTLYQEGSLYKEKGLYICATNVFELGTELEIRTAKEIFGKCIVLDRMNGKYREGIDIFFDKDMERAKQFGTQKLWIKPVGFYKNFEKMAPNPESAI